MTQASFGRRSRPDNSRTRPQAARQMPGVVLTPEQRALILAGDAPTPHDRLSGESQEFPPFRRAPAFAASMGVACLVAALTMVARKHGAAAPPPGLESAAAELLGLGGEDANSPVALGRSVVELGSNLGASLWLTHKICALGGWRGLPAPALAGAAINVALTFGFQSLGLDWGVGGVGVAALAGAGAGAFHRLLSGGGWRMPSA